MQAHSPIQRHTHLSNARVPASCKGAPGGYYISGLDHIIPSACIVVLFRHAYARTVSRQAMELLTTAGGACEEGLRLEGVHSAGRAQVLLQLLDQGVQLDHAGRAEEGLGHPLRRQGQPSGPRHPQRAGALPALLILPLQHQM